MAILARVAAGHASAAAPRIAGDGTGHAALPPGFLSRDPRRRGGWALCRPGPGRAAAHAAGSVRRGLLEQSDAALRAGPSALDRRKRAAGARRLAPHRRAAGIGWTWLGPNLR